jgi:hypothetical protein
VTNSAGKSVTVYSQDSTWRANAWDVELTVAGKLDWANNDLTKDLIAAQIDLAEDCDMDCQKGGSRLSVVASLMSGAYGVIALNALFMFIGAWRYRWRVCSLYCTFCACLC